MSNSFQVNVKDISNRDAIFGHTETLGFIPVNWAHTAVTH